MNTTNMNTNRNRNPYPRHSPSIFSGTIISSPLYRCMYILYMYIPIISRCKRSSQTGAPTALHCTNNKYKAISNINNKTWLRDAESLVYRIDIVYSYMYIYCIFSTTISTIRTTRSDVEHSTKSLIRSGGSVLLKTTDAPVASRLVSFHTNWCRLVWANT